jgi:hypothetical protein
MKERELIFKNIVFREIIKSRKLNKLPKLRDIICKLKSQNSQL